MVKGSKSPRQLGLYARCTSFEFVDLSAVIAPEVMVMSLSRKLVPRSFAGKQHGDEPALFNQGLEIAIYGRDTEIAHAALCVSENLLGREGPTSFNERCAYRVLLPGISRSVHFA